MNCSSCGSSFAEGATLCGTCGAALDVQAPLSVPKADSSQPEAKTDRSPSRNLWAAIRILIAIVWSVLLTSARFSFSAESFGYALGTLFLPFIIAYAITRREEGWYRFSYWFLGLAFLLSIASAPKRLTSLTHSDLLKQMAGTKPVDADLSPRDREVVAVSRAIFSDIQESNRSYSQNITALTPDLQWLYSNESFTSHANIEKALKVIDQMMTLERKNFDAIENLPKVAELHVSQSALSEQERRDFLKGFLSKFNDSRLRGLEKNTLDAEQAWVDGTADLYHYAYQHVQEISIEQGRLVIRRELTRNQFNTRLNRTQQLRTEFTDIKKEYDAARSESLKQQGVTPADLGFEK